MVRLPEDILRLIKTFTNEMEDCGNYMLFRMAALNQIAVAINARKSFVVVGAFQSFPIWRQVWLEKIIEDLEGLGYSISEVSDVFECCQVRWTKEVTMYFLPEFVTSTKCFEVLRFIICLVVLFKLLS